MSRAATTVVFLFLFTACGDPSESVTDEPDSGSVDSGADTAEPDASQEDVAPADTAQDVQPDVDDSYPYLAQGQIDVTVASDSAGAEGLAVIIRHSASNGRRYEGGAPIVVIVDEGWKPGNFERNPIATRIASLGFVVVEGLFPGAEGLARKSGGTYDYRGPNCAAALRDVLRFAGGTTVDTDGKTLTDHLPFADTGNLGVYAKGNGGNIVIVTLAEHAEALPEVDWFLAWESPIGDQYATGELNSNPFYDPGTCDLTTCPWPGLPGSLRFDFGGETRALEFENVLGPNSGKFYLDGDDDGIADETELAFDKMVPGPDPSGEGVLLHPSTELRASIAQVRDELFDDSPDPAWLASEAETAAFWHTRDGAARIREAHVGFPDVMVMHLGTLFDHGLNARDYPHARSHVNGWLQADHAWVRMNPDSVYMAHLTGQDADGYVDNRANRLIPSEGVNAWVELEMVGGVRTDEFIGYAGLLELADRVAAGNREADLDRVLYPDP
jgi:hypothetical protein